MNADVRQESQDPAYTHFTGVRWVFMVSLLAIATFMDVLDVAIANVSINAISGSLAVSPTEGTWVITSYTVASAIAVPLSGWLAQRLGQVRLFVGATSLFTVASWLCGLSGTLSLLIGARVLQGMSAGLMVALGQALMINGSPPSKRPAALSIWSLTVTIAPLWGPLLGGWITDTYSWNWIFYINIVPGIISTIMIWTLFKERESQRIRTPIDIVGLVLLAVWVGSLQVMLDKGNELDWFENRYIVALALTAAAGFCLFLIWELTDAHPVVDLGLFRYRNFSVGLLSMGFGYATFFGGLVLLPLFLQTQIGFTATWSGRIAAPMTVGSMTLAPLYGWLMSRYDFRIFTTYAFGILAFVCFWRTGYTTNADVVTYMAPQVLQGAGLGAYFISLTSIITSDVPPSRMPTATGFQNFARMMVASFGASIAVTLWDHRAVLHRTRLVETLSTPPTRMDGTMTALKQAGIVGRAAYAEIGHLIDVQSYMLAFNDIFWLSGFIYVGLMGVVWLCHTPRRPLARTPGAH